MSAFTEWLNKEHPLTARAAAADRDSTFGIVRDAMELAWDAAVDASMAATVVHPGTGAVRDSINALKVPSQGLD